MDAEADDQVRCAITIHVADSHRGHWGRAQVYGRRRGEDSVLIQVHED